MARVTLPKVRVAVLTPPVLRGQETVFIRPTFSLIAASGKEARRKLKQGVREQGGRRSGSHGCLCESFQESFWEERDENFDGGPGRGWEDDYPLQAKTW